MSDSDNRHITRNSLFILAEMRLDGRDEQHRVKVRNLSGGGMMGEGQVKVTRGARVEINLRHVGWVEGAIAWVEGNRFGIAFAEDVDTGAIRQAVAAPEVPAARILKRPQLERPDFGPSRKII